MAGIYIHIPFCKQACNYCNFHFSTSLQMKDAIIDSIVQEIEIRASYLQNQSIETIYLGGGTPSILDISDLQKIWNAIQLHFPNIDLQEFTLEANPDDLKESFIKDLRSIPVNRLSIGVQSFFDRDLQYMNRAHNATEADYSIKLAQDLGFDNMSIDLIYGTPGLTNEDWKENIHKAQALSINHISSYALTVEPKTALDYQILKGKTVAPSDDQAAAQFEILMQEMQSGGYDHYEISNFALPGKYALHNTNYWKGIHYLGLGPSAHSFNGYSRQWNKAHNIQYINALKDGNTFSEIEILSTEDQMNELIMTSLRTMWGLDLTLVIERFGIESQLQILNQSQDFIQQGYMVKKDEQLILTSQGKLLADGIAAELFF